MEYLPQKMNSEPMTGKVIREKKYKDDFDCVDFNARQASILCRGCTTVHCGLQRSNPSFPPSFSILQRNKAKCLLVAGMKESQRSQRWYLTLAKHVMLCFVSSAALAQHEMQ